MCNNCPGGPCTILTNNRYTDCGRAEKEWIKLTEKPSFQEKEKIKKTCENLINKIDSTLSLNAAKTELIKQQAKALRIKNENSFISGIIPTKIDYQPPNCAICEWKFNDKLNVQIGNLDKFTTYPTLNCNAMGGVCCDGVYNSEECKALFEPKEPDKLSDILNNGEIRKLIEITEKTMQEKPISLNKICHGIEICGKLSSKGITTDEIYETFKECLK